MRLYLLRHGEAEPFRTDDASRALTSRGEEQARRAGAALRRFETNIETIFHSPLLRAQQTARLVSEHFPKIPLKETEHLIPTSDHRQLFDELNRSSGVHSILLVGHEPFLSTLISLLTSGSRNARVVVGTGALSCMEVAAPIKADAGRLLWLLQNEML